MAQSELDVIISASGDAKKTIDGLISKVAGLQTALTLVGKDTSGVDAAAKSIEKLGETTEDVSEKMRLSLTEDAKVLHASIEAKRKAAEEDHKAKREAYEAEHAVIDASKESAKVEKDAKQLKEESRKATRDAAKETKELAKEAEALHKALIESGDGATILKDFLQGLITKALVAGAALFALHEIIQAFKFAIHEAAKEQELSTSLDALATSAGYSSAQVSDAISSVEKFGVAGDEARQALQRLIQSNIDLSKSTELTATAQNLAVIAGTSTGEMLNKIAFSVQRLSPRMLLQAGIVVKLEDAYKKYADTLGISENALTDTQKRLAFIAELTLQGAKATDIAVASLGNYNTQVRAFDLGVNNLGQAVGDGLLPAVTEIVRASTLFVTNLKQVVLGAIETSNIVENLREFMENLGIVFNFVVETLAPLIRAIVLVVDGWLTLANSTTGLIVIFALLLAVLGPIFPILTGIALAIGVLKAAGLDLGDVLNSLIRGFKNVGINTAEVFFTIGDVFSLFVIGLKIKWNDWLVFWGKRTKEEGDKVVNGLLDEIKVIQDAREERERAKKEMLDGDDGNSSSEMVIDARKKLIALNKEVSDSERDIAKARGTGGEAAAITHYKNLKNQQEVQEGLVRKIVEEEAAIKKVTKARDAAAAAAKKEKDLDEAGGGVKKTLDELLGSEGQVKKVLTDMGDMIGVVETKYENMTKGSIDATDKLKSTIADFIKGTLIGVDKVPISLNQVRVGLVKAFGQAKTVEDFSLLLREVAFSGLHVDETIKRFGVNVAFAQQKAALAQLNTELVAYTASVEAVKNLQTLYNQLVQDGLTHQLAVAQVSAEVSGNKQAQYALELRSIAIAQAAVETQFAQDTARTQLLANQKRAVAAQISTNEVDLAVRLRAVEKETSAQSLADATKRYNGLRAVQARYLEDVKKYSIEQRDIEKASAVETRSNDQTIRGIKREGLTDVQQQADRRKEVQEAQAAFESAMAHKQYDDAKEAKDRLKALANEIKGGAGDPAQNRAEAIRIIEQAQADQLELAQTQAAIAATAKIAAQTSLESVTAQIAVVTTQLQSMAADQLLKLKLEVDEPSLIAAIDKIKSAFENVTVNVKAAIQAGGTAIQAAAGGLIPGHSRGVDDQLVLATSGEFMHPVSAVRHYGRDFMESIRNMSFPRYAMGGMIGEVGTARSVEHVSALDISFNKQSVGRVRGSRETLRGLVTALKEVERGVS